MVLILHCAAGAVWRKQQYTLTICQQAQLRVSRTAEQWSIGVWDSHGAGYGGVPLDQQGDDLYGQAISTLPPYFAQNIIVRAL